MYGWLGNYDLGIENNGELMTTERPSSINYVSLKSLQSNIEQVMRADDNLTFNVLVLVILLICACQRLQRAKVNSPK